MLVTVDNFLLITINYYPGGLVSYYRLLLLIIHPGVTLSRTHSHPTHCVRQMLSLFFCLYIYTIFIGRFFIPRANQAECCCLDGACCVVLHARCSTLSSALPHASQKPEPANSDCRHNQRVNRFSSVIPICRNVRPVTLRK
jgi:hypothetical protein